MRKKDVILAGLGGQEVLTRVLFLAHAGMAEGKKAAYVPAYGAEMRGGTAIETGMKYTAELQQEKSLSIA